MWGLAGAAAGSLLASDSATLEEEPNPKLSAEHEEVVARRAMATAVAALEAWSFLLPMVMIVIDN